MEEKSVIYGRNPVLEALRAEQPIDKIILQKELKDAVIGKIFNKAKKKGIVINETSRMNLDKLCSSTAHQGVAAYMAQKEYCSVEEILEEANRREEAPFIVIAEEITDPHNLGSIIRSAECAGAHGVIVPKHGSSPLTGTVAKASAGALSYMNIAKVVNIAQTIEALKEKGLWIYGADMEGEPYQKTNFSGGVALIIGNEGKGLSRLVRQRCDVMVKIPMFGRLDSLNASVAAGVLLLEIARQRHE